MGRPPGPELEAGGLSGQQVQKQPRLCDLLGAALIPWPCVMFTDVHLDLVHLSSVIALSLQLGSSHHLSWISYFLLNKTGKVVHWLKNKTTFG